MLYLWFDILQPERDMSQLWRAERLTMTSLPLAPTSRELLEFHAGRSHSLHSVERKRRVRGQIEVICTCGHAFKVSATPQTSHALRNVADR